MRGGRIARRPPPLCSPAVRGWIATAALLGLTAVAAGAFGAHGLRARVAPEQVASWQTAAHYQLLHAAVLLSLALYGAGGRPLGPAPWLLAAGMALFSGSIYALVLGGPRWLGPVTPLGGLCLMAGWASLLWLARGR
jgi:uncharacterized membrane protein YgdD (TMEM256/DUF423 family)